MIVAHAIHRYTPPAGWVVYDGECGVCAGLARRFRRVLERRGFALVPLQSPWMSSRLRDRKSTRLNSSHIQKSRMPSSA